jgi:hypothetical protein
MDNYEVGAAPFSLLENDFLFVPHVQVPAYVNNPSLALIVPRAADLPALLYGD